MDQNGSEEAELFKSVITAHDQDAYTSLQSKVSGERYQLANAYLCLLQFLGVPNVVLQNETDARKESVEVAKPWLLEQCQHDNMFAMALLGDFYFYGVFENIDFESAAYWYRLAANHGYAGAQFQLGNCFTNGKGVRQDDILAARLYHQAAEQGHSDAQLALAKCYENGIGVEESEINSTLYYCLAMDGNKKYKHLKAQAMFSRDKRVNLIELAKEQNWLNRRNFMLFLYYYTDYRVEHLHTGATPPKGGDDRDVGGAKESVTGVFSIPKVSRHIGMCL